MLTIKDSYLVYKILSPFVENATMNDDILELSSTILYKVEELNRQEDFIALCSLLLNKKPEEIIKEEMDSFIPEFLKSLVENRVFELIEFYRGLNA